MPKKVTYKQAGVNIDLKQVLSGYQKLTQQVDVVLVEGVGGWLVPLNKHRFLQNKVVLSTIVLANPSEMLEKTIWLIR